MVLGRRVGNTKKLGAMLGILKAIGAYVPEPGSPTWTLFMLVQRIFTTFSGASPAQSPPCLPQARPARQTAALRLVYPFYPVPAAAAISCMTLTRPWTVPQHVAG